MTKCMAHFCTTVEFDESRVDGAECPLCRRERLVNDIREELPELLTENGKGELILNWEYTESLEEPPSDVGGFIDDAVSAMNEAESALDDIRRAYRNAKSKVV